MKTLILPCLVAFLILEASGCKPGTKWVEDCNRCSCSSMGIKACTKRLCPPGERQGSDDESSSQHQGGSLRQPDDVAVEHELTKRQTSAPCKPGDKWTVECNSCFCAPSRIPLCTKKACLTDDGIKKESETTSKTKRETQGCKPGDSWKDDCHTCHCPNGIPACTRELCSSEQGGPLNLDMALPRDKRETKTTCKEGESWMDDCNSCHCDKGRPACTRKLCKSQQEPLNLEGVVGRDRRETKTTCQAGEVWEDECNTCFCNDDGGIACTKMECRGVIAGLHRSLRETKTACVDGEQWVDGCNHCHCAKGEPACSKMGCDDTPGPTVNLPDEIWDNL